MAIHQGLFISHETIYRRIRADESGELRRHCWHKLKYRHHKLRFHKTEARHIPDRISIHDRPPEADGKRFGDWEMDLIVGKEQKSAILTLCERSVNYLIMAPLLGKGKNLRDVAHAAIEALLPYKRYVKTITTDNGPEFMAHKLIAKKTGCHRLFCRLLRLMAERRHRKLQQTHKAIHT